MNLLKSIKKKVYQHIKLKYMMVLLLFFIKA